MLFLLLFLKMYFFSDDEKEKELYICIKELLEKYINNYEAKNTSNKNGLDEKELYDEYSVISSKEPLGKIIERFEMLNIESVERYIYYFFKVVKRLFPES